MHNYTFLIVTTLAVLITGCTTTEIKSSVKDFLAPATLDASASLSASMATAARKALVIGNKQYPASGGFLKLTNPVNDATAMAGKLTGYGFTVTTVLNADKDRFEAAVATFINTINPGDVALVYYSGHGTVANCPQRANTQHNYLVPVGAVIHGKPGLCQYGISVQELLDKLIQKDGGINILLIDACREPMPTNFAANTESKGIEADGFIEMQGVRTFIGYASEPNTISFGGSTSDYSWYTDSLLKRLNPPYDDLPIETLFKTVQADVSQRVGENGQRQLPWFSSEGLIGDFCFRTPCVSVTELALTSLRTKQSDAGPSSSPAKQPIPAPKPPTVAAATVTPVIAPGAGMSNTQVKIGDFTMMVDTTGKPLALNFDAAQQAYAELPYLSNCTTIGKMLDSDPRTQGSLFGFWARSATNGAIGACLRGDGVWIVNSHSTTGTYSLLKTPAQPSSTRNATANTPKPQAPQSGDMLTNTLKNVWTQFKSSIRVQ